MLPFQQPIEINEEERLLKEGSMKEISTAAGLSFYWRLNMKGIGKKNPGLSEF